MAPGLTYLESLRRALARNPGAGPGRRGAGGGHPRSLRRRLQGDAGPLHPFPGPGLHDAHLRGVHRGDERGPGAAGAASHCGDHVRRFRRAGGGPARQPRGQVPGHVQRAGDGAAGGAHAHGWRPGLRADPQPVPRTTLLRHPAPEADRRLACPRCGCAPAPGRGRPGAGALRRAQAALPAAAPAPRQPGVDERRPVARLLRPRVACVLRRARRSMPTAIPSSPCANYPAGAHARRDRRRLWRHEPAAGAGARAAGGGGGVGAGLSAGVHQPAGRRGGGGRRGGEPAGARGRGEPGGVRLGRRGGGGRVRTAGRRSRWLAPVRAARDGTHGDPGGEGAGGTGTHRRNPTGSRDLWNFSARRRLNRIRPPAHSDIRHPTSDF